MQISPPNPQTGYYPIAVNGVLKVATRRPDLQGTAIPGNLAQCKPIVLYNQTAFPGQFPVAAVDSSNGTAWQPSLPSPAFIVVDLESLYKLSSVHINWGDSPALSFQLLVSNDSTTFTQVLDMGVEISQPYNATLAAVVGIFQGNSTDATFDATFAR